MLCLLSFGAGYLLNEELSIKRIVRSLNYLHEGWFFHDCDEGIVIYWIFAVLSFAKAYTWAIVIDAIVLDDYYFVGCFYVLGNFLAAGKTGGLRITPWVSVLGILVAW